MKKLRRRVFVAAGYNTISLGTGRKEFHPKKERPGLEEYMKEAGGAVIAAAGGADKIDESVVGNFIASRFNRQANMAAFMPFVDPGLLHKPAIRVEGACATGGLAVISALRSVLSDTADTVLVLGVEVQNTVKAIYGADILAAAGWAKERKTGHAYFFPGQFSNRAGACYKKFGMEKTRRAMARWYRQAIENARLCPTAQEYQNTTENLEALALVDLTPGSFVDNLTLADCSKVSDGASALLVLSEDGLKRSGIAPSEAIEIMGWAQLEGDITRVADDLTVLDNTKAAAREALASASIGLDELATVETHDCFSIAGVLATEAIGFAPHGGGPDFILAGNTARNGRIPFNTTGGLIGWGHPTGATGVHQAVTLWEQLTGRAGAAQIDIPQNRPYALSVNMGGDDKTLVSIVYRRGA